MLKNVFILIISLNLISLVFLGYSGIVTIQYGDDVVIDCEMTYWPYCYGDEEIAAITYFSSNGRWERYYIKIPLPDFLNGEVIDSAKFQIYKVEISPHSNQSFTFTVNRLLEELTDYYEKNVGNIIAPAHHSFNFDTSASYTYDYLGWIDLDVTDLVQNWLNLTFPNDGFLVRMLNETSPTHQLIVICQSLYQDETKWPILQLYGSSLPDTFLTSAGITKLNKHHNAAQTDSVVVSNYPNPFNPFTHIEFDVRQSCQVTLKIYDVQGQLMTTLVDQTMIPGTYKVKFNGFNLASGIYFYQVKMGDYITTKKMLLSR